MANPTEELARRLVSPDADIRAAAAEALCLLHDGARAAAVALVRAVNDTDERVRQFAAAALEDIGPPEAVDVSPLAAILGESPADCAYWAATLLGRLGPQAEAAVPMLADSLANAPAAHVRERAAWALGKIGPSAGSALPVLETAAASDNARLARLAKAAIESIQS